MKCLIGSPFSGENMMKCLIGSPFSGENVMKCPLGCFSSEENMMMCRLQRPSSGENEMKCLFFNIVLPQRLGAVHLSHRFPLTPLHYFYLFRCGVIIIVSDFPFIIIY